MHAAVGGVGMAAVRLARLWGVDAGPERIQEILTEIVELFAVGCLTYLPVRAVPAGRGRRSG